MNDLAIRNLRVRKDEQVSLNIPLEGYLGYQLRRASVAMQKHLSSLYKKLGFKVIEGSVLLMIEANPGIKQSQIGKTFDIKSANLVPLVGFLEKNDCIERKPIDGRSHGLFLTAYGKKIIKEIHRHIEENERWLRSRLVDIDPKLMAENLHNIWS